MRSCGNETASTPEGDLPSAVARCRSDAELLRRLQEIYAEADRASAAVGRACLGGGACCRFDLAGHRLYLSVAELAMLTSLPPADIARAQRARCPYQSGPTCTAYARRPLGCRVFFCRDHQELAARPLYERLHRQIRSLHQSHCIPYAYGELCQFIMQLFTDK